MMRIALFLLTNLAVMVVFGLVLSLTGIQSSSMTGLLIMALLFGFGGSIVSLLMSKWMALKSVGGEVIEQPPVSAGGAKFAAIARADDRHLEPGAAGDPV